ncbi:hypothetical protein M758_3G147400 [Ceratodon purpureus]|uniref:Glycosylphosphatidylinositol anchor biosynthesis protein 11 n=1 Tax=Ceratodon purpureus TaxID=3225 RepID=A0A8T0IJU2_CERPU|nr:hypothetical protein KC19_3G146100 [Ceratodon purpureus]KAG0623076.1 hypothetical protein M758_3G147400 [Ceratodon purpureus]
MADQQKAEVQDDGFLSRDPGAIALLSLQGLCGVALVVGVKTVPAYYGLNLIAHPVAAIRCALALTLPTVVVAYTLLYIFSSRPRPVWRCIGSGLLSLPLGTVVIALLALAFGAPTSLQYASRTLHWAFLMSVLVVLPAAIVLGSSWPDWQRIFAFTRPRGGLERAICIPAHGALIGAWVGAFPMPLDWERPWQEWPISCTYGAAGGYLVGLTISILLQFLLPKDVRSKVD